MYKKLLALALVLGIALTASAVLAQPQTQTPSGTIRITLNSTSALMGSSWGQAVLTFQGRNHLFRVRGLKVGAVGIHRISLRGDVYNLYNINDLGGTYHKADPAGLTFTAGKSGLVIRNDRAVTINLVARKSGMSLDLVQEGLTLHDAVQPAPR